MQPLIEVINKLRPDLHSLYRNLFDCQRRMYHIDYDSLGRINETESS